MSRNRIAIVVLLSFAGAAVSGLLLFDHHGVGTASSTVHQLCGAEEESGCDEVAGSAYSSFGNFSLAAIGVFFYGSMMLLLAVGLASSEAVRSSASAVALLLFGAALVLDVALLGIQAFAIGAFCRLCIATYVVNALAFLTLLPARPKLAESLVPGEPRRALSVWAVGSVVLLVGIAAVDQALASTSARTPASLLGERVEPPSPPVVDAGYVPAGSNGDASSAAPPEPQSDEERIARLESRLEEAQTRIRELQEIVDDPEKFQSYQAEKAAQAFELQTPQNLALEDIPFKGPADAPIKVVEFSDFMCPYCRNLAGAFANFMAESSPESKRVAIYFKNYPLDQACNEALSRTVHDGACELALGAVCAEEQGKFWPYHDRVFSQEHGSPTYEDVVGIASAAGLDPEAMRACLESSEAKAKLDAQIQEGIRVGVNATPTVFVNGKKLEQIGGFMKALESEARRLGLSPQ